MTTWPTSMMLPVCRAAGWASAVRITAGQLARPAAACCTNVLRFPPIGLAPLHAIVESRIAQSRLERIEPRLEFDPLIQAIAENRPAHLFGTGRAHAAPGLVEI